VTERDHFTLHIAARVQSIEREIADLPLMRYKLDELTTGSTKSNKSQSMDVMKTVKEMLPLILIGILIGSMLVTQNPGGLIRLLTTHLFMK